MNVLTSAADAAIEQDLKQFLIILLVALSAASLPKIFTALRELPYTLLLLIVGLGLALMDVRLMHLSPGLILMVFLPPLLFEAAWNMRWSALKRELLPSGLFAVGGVLVSIAGIAIALNQMMNVPWTTALLVGACLSATDSASVLGIFRQVGAGERLTTLLEGESLLNDGAAVVAFGVLLDLATDPKPFQLSSTMLEFFVVTGIGVSIGALIGICVAVLTQRYELAWVEQALTLVTAYGTYLFVEELGGSGVIGVVTAGLVIGNFSVQPGVELVKSSTVAEFWEFIVFLINSLLFLLLGDQIHVSKLINNLPTTSIAVLAVIVSRAIAVYGFSALSNWIGKTGISWQNQTIIWWTGLRGAVSIALAIGLPALIPGRQEIISASFGAVWFTLLLQGLTTKFFLGKLDLLEDQSLKQQYLELIARRDALQQVTKYLMQTGSQLLIDPESHQTQLETVQKQLQQIQTEIEKLQEQSEVQAFSLGQYQEQLHAIESQTYAKFVQAGLLKRSLTPMVKTSIDLPKSSNLETNVG
ncbi:Na+/H+ antiporter [Leptolyngbya sp. NIES-3755]|nr:Na+/H+ antiporter [Leptolyngbya sp. NIES-3755]